MGVLSPIPIWLVARVTTLGPESALVVPDVVSVPGEELAYIVDCIERVCAHDVIGDEVVVAAASARDGAGVEFVWSRLYAENCGDVFYPFGWRECAPFFSSGCVLEGTGSGAVCFAVVAEILQAFGCELIGS